VKDRLKALIENQPTHLRPGLVREFLQCVALRTMHEIHAFQRVAFVGGTALRLLYLLPRFSEDLDFSLVSQEGFDLAKIMTSVESSFKASAIDAEISYDQDRTVQIAWLSFPGLLHEVGISRDPRRKLSIKLDVDCNPPAGAVVEQRLINRHFLMAITHYDLPSLFAGKLHAVLTRPYVKGRDYYDLVWYMTRHQNLAPNVSLLNAALEQTKWSGKPVSLDTWKSEVKKRILGVDWAGIVRDVSPFLEDEKDIELMKLEYVLPLFK